MEQPETPQEPPAEPVAGAVPPAAEAPAAPAAKPQLPDTRNAYPIPDKFRLPFHGKMVTPTAVPSAMERAYRMAQEQKRRRRRGFLLGLLVGQLLIIALDKGGELALRLFPQAKIQAPVGVASIVFLGMAAGAALLLLAVGLIYLGMALKSLFGRKSAGVVASAGGGILRVVLTTLAMGVSIGVIIGTAWFMIPYPEWKPTVEFAKGKGRLALDASTSKVRSMFGPSSPRTP